MHWLDNQNRRRRLQEGVLPVIFFLLAGFAVAANLRLNLTPSDRHWAFQPVGHPSPPKVKRDRWPRSPV
jgi:hypothetical protein